MVIYTHHQGFIPISDSVLWFGFGGIMRKTKIICTLGPATAAEETLRELILAGMNAARFNFSHGSHEEHLQRFKMLDKLRRELKLPIATILDTKGPEVRLGEFDGGVAMLAKGSVFRLTSEDVLGDNSRSSISYKNLIDDVTIGTRILLDDGLIELKVTQIDRPDIVCQVVNGGIVSDKKGVNIPGLQLSMPYISDKDREDIIFGLKTGFDFIAASFVRGAEDVLAIRKIMTAENCHHVKIIAKIENADGVENIDQILRLADGVMVARGDMGVEIPLEDVPVLQKLLIKKAYNAGKQVITATQMLDSMIKNPRPTRAETNDVANAIYDGTSAIMLSGETAAGAYPIEAVKTMASIAERTERDIDYRGRFFKRDNQAHVDVTNAISHATCTTAFDLDAAAIMPITISGQTARMVSKYRPDIPILGCTTNEFTWRQLNLSWGVTPLMLPQMSKTDELFEAAVNAALAENLVKSGDLVVISAGVPLGISGTTNLMKVHIVGNVLVAGRGVNSLSRVGTLRVAQNEQEVIDTFNPGEILVIKQTSNNILHLLKQASGIITEEDGLNSHAAVVGLTLDIPVIVGATNATSMLKSGTTANLDADRGIVCNSSIK